MSSDSSQLCQRQRQLEAAKNALVPLTRLHHKRIAKAAPKVRGKVVETLLP